MGGGGGGAGGARAPPPPPLHPLFCRAANGYTHCFVCVVIGDAGTSAISVIPPGTMVSLMPPRSLSTRESAPSQPLATVEPAPLQCEPPRSTRHCHPRTTNVQRPVKHRLPLWHHEVRLSLRRQMA